MFDRALSTFVALSLALLVWVYARSREQETLDHVAIPVHVSLTAAQRDQYILEVLEPSHVLCSFTGAPGRMRELRSLLQRGELRSELTLTVPESANQQKSVHETLHVDPGTLHLPAGIKPILMEGRDSVRVVAQRVIEKRLPVRFDYSLESHTGAVVVEPSSVLVRGPQDVLERASAIPTQPWVISPRGSQAGEEGDGAPVRAARVPVLQELEGRSVKTQPTSVTVRLPTQQRKLYELTDVPVRFLCPANFAYRPRFINERAGKITLRVLGPVQQEPPRVNAVIDLTTNEFTARMYSERPHIQLPKDFHLAQDLPREVTFELLPLMSLGEKGPR